METCSLTFFRNLNNIIDMKNSKLRMWKNLDMLGTLMNNPLEIEKLCSFFGLQKPWLWIENVEN